MTKNKTVRQYGLWESPISPGLLSADKRLLDVAWGRDGSLVWLESQGGQGALKCQTPDGQAPRRLNSQLSVRARLNYGGGDFSVGRDNVYFVEADSARIYRQSLDGGFANPLTPAFGRAASPVESPDGKWLLFVHSYEEQDALAIVPVDGTAWPAKLVSKQDFYMQPVWHPGGEWIAWVGWDHPQMPWDGARLFMGRLEFSGAPLPWLAETTLLAGDHQTAVSQPQFSQDGRYLAYVSDASGWWQLYVYDLENGEHHQLTDAAAEHAQPAWLQGMRTYGFTPDSRRLFFLRNREGIVSLWQYDLALHEDSRLSLEGDYTYLEQISVSDHGLALIASGEGEPTRLITCELGSDMLAGKTLQTVIRSRTSSEEIPEKVYARARPVSWPGMDGEPVFGLFYSPHNLKFQGTGAPPLVVRAHSGPTSQTYAGFNPLAQFFCSRGYAVLEVNYRGSTGYGKEYRDKLQGSWGIYDVQDAVSGARHLVSQDLVDASRLVIMGSSASGFTVLQALIDYPGFFRAGICLYGISNQFNLAAETHKFEAHYSDFLLGPLPQAAEVYRQRSPIFFVDKIQDPVALFQGENDSVVNRSQSDELAHSLARRAIPHVYHVYPDEGHGFRKPETIDHLYKTIDKFLRQYVIYV